MTAHLDKSLSISTNNPLHDVREIAECGEQMINSNLLVSSLTSTQMEKEKAKMIQVNTSNEASA